MKSLSALAALLLVLVVGIATFGRADAAGYKIGQESVSGAGVAHAGGAASAGDASTVYANPAGMTQLDGRQLVVGGHLLRPDAKFANQGSIDATGAAITGGEGGQGGNRRFRSEPLRCLESAERSQIRSGHQRAIRSRRGLR